MDAAVADAKKPIVTDKELRICIQLPHCPWLNLVDLPGLVIAHANPELPQLTEALAQSVVAEEKNHGIFLLVVEATAQASQSLATKLLQQAKVLDRTLDIYTKCDRVSADEQNRLSKGMIIEKLLNETAPGSIHLPNGWICCSIVIAEEMQAVPIDGCRETMRLPLGRYNEVTLLRIAAVINEMCIFLSISPTMKANHFILRMVLQYIHQRMEALDLSFLCEATERIFSFAITATG